MIYKESQLSLTKNELKNAVSLISAVDHMNWEREIRHEGCKIQFGNLDSMGEISEIKSKDGPNLMRGAMYSVDSMKHKNISSHLLEHHSRYR